LFEPMDSLDYWRLCDEVSVVQAALLIVGCDPSESQEYVMNWDASKRPIGFDAAMAALTHAILAERLPATIRRSARERGWNEEPEEDENIGHDSRARQIIYKSDPNWSISTVAVDDLRTWLRARALKSGFFFAEEGESVDYLDAQNPHYSPKLAAAIGAWQAVSRDSTQTRGKTVKQAIAIWLRRNADRFGLTKDDGSPNEQGIEEVSKIANWDTKGGAPKTPGE
jgi:hypothetical protein